MPNSLAWRLLAFLSLWIVAALIVTGLLISTVFRNNAEEGFSNLLQAHAYNLIGAIELGDDGSLAASPDFGDPRFSAPLSGWYWFVSLASAPQKPVIHSRSISGDDVELPPVKDEPFDRAFKRIYTIEENGSVSQRFETQLYLGDEGDILYQVSVAGGREAVNESIADFTKTLWMFFSVFAVGTIAVAYIAIRSGLVPLRKAAQELSQIRIGQQDRLDGDYPVEVQPLAGEINALIEANKSVIERARTQVGNLAHALKTPLAVIMNEKNTPGEGSWGLVGDQARLMETQVRNYLDRARISAQRGNIVARTSFHPVARQIVGVMRKLTPNVNFELQSTEEDPPGLLRIEEQDLQEILGNLLENASRFARQKVVVSCAKKTGRGQMTSAVIAVEDDGPGLDEKEIELALKRGQRLDETTKGSGLGLSIVSDIADEYGGELVLNRSEMLGGLKACVSLPIVAFMKQS